MLFRLIKAHDGLRVGETKDLPESPLTDYMVKNGYWEKVEETKTSPILETKVETTKKGKKK